MNEILLIPRPLAITLLLGAWLAPLGSTAVAAPRCERPNNPIDLRACNVAKEGPQALRRFVARTQSVYMLDFHDYMSDADLRRHYARAQGRTQARAVVHTDLGGAATTR